MRAKAESSNAKSQNNDQNKGGEDKQMQSEPNEQNTSKNQEKAYSFEDEQKRKILNDLLRKEAETRRRIERKQGASSKNGKDW